jgi:hypothetical protein
MVHYYTLLWGAWRLLEGNCTGEAIDLLRRCKAHTTLPQTLMVSDWAGNIGRWLVRDGRAASEGRRFFALLRTAADMDERQWDELQPRLESAEPVQATGMGMPAGRARWWRDPKGRSPLA